MFLQGNRWSPRVRTRWVHRFLHSNEFSNLILKGAQHTEMSFVRTTSPESTKERLQEDMLNLSWKLLKCKPAFISGCPTINPRWCKRGMDRSRIYRWARAAVTGQGHFFPFPFINYLLNSQTHQMLTYVPGNSGTGSALSKLGHTSYDCTERMAIFYILEKWTKVLFI